MRKTYEQAARYYWMMGSLNTILGGVEDAINCAREQAADYPSDMGIIGVLVILEITEALLQKGITTTTGLVGGALMEAEKNER